MEATLALNFFGPFNAVLNPNFLTANASWECLAAPRIDLPFISLGSGIIINKDQASAYS